MKEQESYVEGRGNLMMMEKPCKDCRKPWGMYESEMAFYKNLVDTLAYRMPVRCPECRKKKREVKGKGDIRLQAISSRIFEMAKHSAEGAYTFHDEILERDLRAVGDQLNLYIKQNRTHNDEQG